MAGKDRPPLRPTVVAIPPRRAPGTKGARPPQAPPAPDASRTAAPSGARLAPTRPTAVAGVERKRVPVTAADLRRLAPEADGATVERASELVGGFVPEKASERRAILWGHDIQTAYAERVSEALDLAGAPALERARSYVARMIEILGSFDLAAAAARAGGPLGGALRAFGGRADTAGEIERARAELDHLTRLMAGALDDLLALKDRIERNAAQLEGLAREAEAASLAALHLAEHLRPRLPAVAERLVERSMSLSQMVAQLHEHRGLREAQTEQPLRLIGAMRHAALVALPGLLSGLAAFAGPRPDGRGPTPTEAGETTRRIHEIVRQLKA